MKKTLVLFATALTLLTTSCAHKSYTSSSFDQQAAGHRMIAVLPAEMIFTGNQPKNLRPEDIAALEEKESRAFQQSLYNGILRNANSGKFYSTVQVQDLATTMRLLEENGISVRRSWTSNDKELAAILGVDAIVRMQIRKTRYMSDLASMGIGIGRDILWQVSARNNVLTPPVSNKTSDIFASCNLVSGSATLWNDTYERSADYTRPAEEVIENITNKFGKNFPYRKRRA